MRVDAPLEAPISLSINLPLIDVEQFPDTCMHEGFANDQEAANFWNEHATDGGDGRRLRIQVDKKSVGSPSGAHFTEVFWDVNDEVFKMRNGNHTLYGAATWTGSGDSYSLTGGGLSIILPQSGGSTDPQIQVACNATSLGTSFAFDLTR